MAFAPDYVTLGLFYIYYTRRARSERSRSTSSSALTPIPISPIRASAESPADSAPATRTTTAASSSSAPTATSTSGPATAAAAAIPTRRTEPEDLARQDPSHRPARARPIGEYTIPPDNPFFNQPPKRGEIWSYGLRNPWRFSFDRQTGDFSIGDVGQASRRRSTSARAHRATARHELRLELPRGPAPLRSRRIRSARRAAAGLHRTGPRVLTRTRGCSITGGYVDARTSAAAAHRPVRLRRRLHVAALAHPAPGPRRAGRHRFGRGHRPAYTFGEDACARVYAGAGSGNVYRLIPTNRLRRRSARLHAARRTLIGIIEDDGGRSPARPQGNDLNGGTLPAGTYNVQVDDTSTLHNFHLEGPGVPCVPPSDCMTDVAGIGRETWLVNFTPGQVTYHCDPHPTIIGSFVVIVRARRRLRHRRLHRHLRRHRLHRRRHLHHRLRLRHRHRHRRLRHRHPPPPPPPPRRLRLHLHLHLLLHLPTATSTSTSTSTSATATTTASASTATASASAPPPPPPPPPPAALPRSTRHRIAAWRRKAADPQGKLFRRPGAPRSHEAIAARPRHRPEPEAGRLRRPGFPVNLLVGRG